MAGTIPRVVGGSGLIRWVFDTIGSGIAGYTARPFSVTFQKSIRFQFAV